MLRKALGFSLFLMASFVVWLNINNLSEAFGNGPPYYSRTTNMDKWENPLPMIIAIDSGTCIALAVFFFNKRRTKG